MATTVLRRYFLGATLVAMQDVVLAGERMAHRLACDGHAE
jgi:hypothetical protein